MPFTICPYHCFPIQCPISCSSGSFIDVEMVWSFSLTGWRLSGDFPMRPGEKLSLAITPPNKHKINVDEAVVRWSRGGQELAEGNMKIAPCRS
mgnify:CR=1 FL=1